LQRLYKKIIFLI